ncbi:unnamed protein product, partial [Heterosigma akashiwo]
EGGGASWKRPSFFSLRRQTSTESTTARGEDALLTSSNKGQQQRRPCKDYCLVM